eukprot:528207-Karenia_brevis.AAC.1
MTAHVEGPTTLVIHNTYQPHAGEQNIDKKNKEYRKMHEIRLKETKENTCYILAGDFNARILREDGTVKEYIGSNFLKTNKTIEEINKDVWENRE